MGQVSTAIEAVRRSEPKTSSTIQPATHSQSLHQWQRRLNPHLMMFLLVPLGIILWPWTRLKFGDTCLRNLPSLWTCDQLRNSLLFTYSLLSNCLFVDRMRLTIVKSTGIRNVAWPTTKDVTHNTFIAGAPYEMSRLLISPFKQLGLLLTPPPQEAGYRRCHHHQGTLLTWTSLISTQRWYSMNLQTHSQPLANCLSYLRETLSRLFICCPASVFSDPLHHVPPWEQYAVQESLMLLTILWTLDGLHCLGGRQVVPEGN